MFWKTYANEYETCNIFEPMPCALQTEYNDSVLHAQIHPRLLKTKTFEIKVISVYWKSNFALSCDAERQITIAVKTIDSQISENMREIPSYFYWLWREKSTPQTSHIRVPVFIIRNDCKIRLCYYDKWTSLQLSWRLYIKHTHTY